MRPAGAAACLLLLLVAQPLLSSSSIEKPSCKFEYTSLALLSCEDTTPQTPTHSCCDALLYAVDVWPLSSLDQGVCCLCSYLVAKGPLAFDLAGACVACRGKDAAAVQVWRQQFITTPADCKEPCRRGAVATAAPPPPPGPRSSGRRHLGIGAIIGIVAACVAAMVLVGWCLYRALCSPAAKQRRSPDPSNSGTATSQPEGTEMARLSSARYSTSRLIQEEYQCTIGSVRALWQSI